MEFHFHNNSPIYLQISEILEKEIVSGRWQPSDKLPSVRELAILSKTNPNTVQKALQDLEQKGLIYTKRTSGKFITDDSLVLRQRREELALKACRKLVAELDILGYAREDIPELLKKG